MRMILLKIIMVFISSYLLMLLILNLNYLSIGFSFLDYIKFNIGYIIGIVVLFYLFIKL
jgi:hypothetical protein